MASANMDHAQKIPYSDLAKQAFKEALLEVNQNGQWTGKADKLTEAFIEMIIKLAKSEGEGASEKRKQ
jgi:hypothetical protein